MTTYSESAKIPFHDELKTLMNELAHSIYDNTESFPQNEIFGLTSQLRRAGLSIILNYIEGYARRRNAVLKNFLDISYGSLKEVKYLLYFSYKRNYLSEIKYIKGKELTDRIGRMLWGILEKI